MSKDSERLVSVDTRLKTIEAMLKDWMSNRPEATDTKPGLVTPSSMKFQDGDRPGIFNGDRVLCYDGPDDFAVEPADTYAVIELPMKRVLRDQLTSGDIALMADAAEVDHAAINNYFLILDDEWHVCWTLAGGVARETRLYSLIWKVII